MGEDRAGVEDGVGLLVKGYEDVEDVFFFLIFIFNAVLELVGSV